MLPARAWVPIWSLAQPMMSGPSPAGMATAQGVGGVLRLGQVDGHVGVHLGIGSKCLFDGGEIVAAPLVPDGDINMLSGFFSFHGLGWFFSLFGFGLCLGGSRRSAATACSQHHGCNQHQADQDPKFLVHLALLYK